MWGGLGTSDEALGGVVGSQGSSPAPHLNEQLHSGDYRNLAESRWNQGGVLSIVKEACGEHTNVEKRRISNYRSVVAT